ncbi:S9 family peptidase [Tahibacter harae]|uniref:Prolyl oligopeptidase family serine peptidase n=1 Tax=Tahibacter harae TaxID=2963937 RepID=A0ABT1QY65_9GAMM|nr:prolyl oligopeptidase family serine peptidase [Tahibacter harae]MCQ4167226.1 prolyl oligopeptidase family serine peptidase [Tahibacter harae]
MSLRSSALAAALVTVIALPAQAALTLDQIMAEPDWIGAPVESPYWSADGSAVYYALKRPGNGVRDIHRIALSDNRDSVLSPAELAGADGSDAVYDQARRRAAFVRNGDIFVRDLAGNRLIQVTRSTADERNPQFSADQSSLQYRLGNDWYSYDFASGVNAPVAVLKTEKNPRDKKPGDFEQLQLRLIGTLKQDYDNKQALKDRADELRKADPSRAAEPVYLGDDVQVSASLLSPDGRWLLVATTPKGHDGGRAGKMPMYVTESGYEEIEDVRTRVGRGDPAPDTLWRVDLASQAVTRLDYSGLPGIEDDPLAAVRAENEKAKDSAKDAKADDKGKSGKDKKDARKSDKPEKVQRPLTVAAMQFTRDGSQGAVVLRAIDNKDRWIVSVSNSEKPALTTRHRLTDPAWINWNFNEFGWLPDNRTLWYVSEESGYAALYTRRDGDKPKAVVQGRFEVSSPVVSPDGNWFYLRSNAEAPYAYDAYRVPTAGGEFQRLTQFKGLESFALSPDGKQLLAAHSASYVPQQISVLPADGGSPRQLTDTRSAAFKAMSWQAPQIVGVPSSHTKDPIWGKLYTPAGAAAGKRPIVLFVHGAGYTQNTHLSYPYYFREQMFHNLLTERGYLVLDLDYRASEGYGRDWRTAIYRHMGKPELEDLIDGVNWLVKEHNGDASRVGVYGGSYGGFMTLIAMFQAPEVFKAGAALRPVTDWTQYNHEYTSNILNTPQIDDIAYRRSSPIEFADGLKGALLIAHGMIDDNVFFQDSVRLFQRLIELKKDNVELAPYPLERHGFVHAAAWRDEYARILKLFETHVRGVAAP